MAERAPTAEDHPYPVGLDRTLIVASIILGTLMGAIDMSIVNVALPNIRASLGVTLTEISWVATGYLVSVVVILPLTAWLAAVIGRKRLYILAQVIFVGSSILCGLSHSRRCWRTGSNSAPPSSIATSTRTTRTSSPATRPSPRA